MPGKASIGAQARSGWTREPELLDVSSKVGERLRTVRLARGLSLKEASDMTGVPSATLSRIENNRMAPTIGLLFKVVEGFQLPWSEILPESMGLLSAAASQADPRSADTAGGLAPGKPIILRSGDVDYELLHPDNPLTQHLAPIVMTIKHRTIDEVGGLVGHKHTEFCLVLDGVLQLHFKGKKTRTLQPGDSALFEASTPHGYTSKSGAPVKILLVVTA